MAIFAMFTLGASAHEKTDSFKVYGNCQMCKTRIEKASEVEGVKKAVWDMETKMLTITYNPDKVKLDDIQKGIAAVGHDTEKFSADAAVYKKLHGCCKYERKAVKKKASDGHEGHKH